MAALVRCVRYDRGLVVRVRMLVVRVRMLVCVTGLMQMLCLQLVRVRLCRGRALMLEVTRWSRRIVQSALTGRALGEPVAFEDIDLDRRDATAVYSRHTQRCIQVHRACCALHHFKRHTRTEQCSKHHVAGDSGETIEIGDAHVYESFTVAIT